MKKSIFALLLAFPLVFLSCKKDDDGPSTPDSLVGTTWVFTQNIPVMSYSSSTTFTFTSSQVTMTTSTIGPDESATNTSTVSYSYSKPKVIIGSGSNPMQGTVTGNKMTFTQQVEGGTSTYVLTLQ